MSYSVTISSLVFVFKTFTNNFCFPYSNDSLESSDRILEKKFQTQESEEDEKGPQKGRIEVMTLSGSAIYKQ